jgi:hypothetical protein
LLLPLSFRVVLPMIFRERHDYICHVILADPIIKNCEFHRNSTTPQHRLTRVSHGDSLFFWCSRIVSYHSLLLHKWCGCLLILWPASYLNICMARVHTIYRYHSVEWPDEVVVPEFHIPAWVVDLTRTCFTTPSWSQSRLHNHPTCHGIQTYRRSLHAWGALFICLWQPHQWRSQTCSLAVHGQFVRRRFPNRWNAHWLVLERRSTKVWFTISLDARCSTSTSFVSPRSDMPLPSSSVRCTSDVWSAYILNPRLVSDSNDNGV